VADAELLTVRGHLRLVEPEHAPIEHSSQGTGMVDPDVGPSQTLHWRLPDVDKEVRADLNRQQPCVLWLTGLSEAETSTIANLVESELYALGRHTYLLDGDNVQRGLNRDLGFSNADRAENIRRIAEVAKLMVDAGLIVLAAVVSPFREDRQTARELFEDEEFIEIFVDTTLRIAGVDAAYEAPENPDVRIDTTALSPRDAAWLILDELCRRQLISLP
jgi:bifunctional enzyme CysN/CysC